MDVPSKLENLGKQHKLPAKYIAILRKFFESYTAAIKERGANLDDHTELLNTYFDLIIEQIQHPYPFEPYHERMRSPFDYYALGLEFIRPLVVLEQSKVLGIANIHQIEAQLAKGENVVLLANHQTEPDPQAISILLEKTHPKLAEEMIFVAGHRVISDPLAIPFSMGRNLLCIFSKKHIENPPEKKQEKLTHNQKTMKKLGQLLAEGGKCIYVAPSGGRDRADAHGRVDVAPFDPQSIEMFWLISQQAGTKTHFYPLALATYDLLPPPSSVEVELGEHRHAQCTPIHLAFGAEVDMENIPGCDEIADKKLRRIKRAEHIWNLVCQDYEKIRE